MLWTIAMVLLVVGIRTGQQLYARWIYTPSVGDLYHRCPYPSDSRTTRALTSRKGQ